MMPWLTTGITRFCAGIASRTLISRDFSLRIQSRRYSPAFGIPDRKFDDKAHLAASDMPWLYPIVCAADGVIS